MAIGDVVLFNQFLESEANGVHDLDNDDILVGLVDSTITPSATTADPRWGSAGTTDLSANEVATGGNYALGGLNVAASISRSGGTVTFDGVTNPSWAQHASNPTDARWGIIYNGTIAGNDAIGFVDLGSVFDMTTGALTITWNASGIATKT